MTPAQERKPRRRPNHAEIARLTAERNTLQQALDEQAEDYCKSSYDAYLKLTDALDRADRAESHPFLNLAAWLRRRVAR